MSLIDYAHKDYYLLIRLSYGEDSEIRLTTWSEDVVREDPDTLVEETWDSVRAIAVQFPEHGGGMEEGVCRLSMPRGDFTSRLADGLPHSPVSLRVIQVFFETARNESGAPPVVTKEYHAFRGRIDRTYRNPNGKTGSIDLQFKDVKAAFKLPLGITVGPKCSWPFASEPCGVTIPPEFIVTSTVVAIRGTQIEVDLADLPVTSDPIRNLYHRGYAEVDGLRIGIKFQASGNAFIQLYKVPPAEWLDAEVLLFPGCDKTLERCREWDNEVNNGTFGSIMTNYNPNVRSV